MWRKTFKRKQDKPRLGQSICPNSLEFDRLYCSREKMGISFSKTIAFETNAKQNFSNAYVCLSMTLIYNRLTFVAYRMYIERSMSKQDQ